MNPIAAATGGTGLLLWVAFPYICLAVFAVGHVWRYRQDQFGWTSRTTQLLEHRWLRWGSPLFHLGAFAVIGGHVVGLAVPASWTEAAGISEHAYHTTAVALGSVAGLTMVTGLGMLSARRLLARRIRLTTDRVTFLDLVDEIANDPTFRLDMDFAPGDVQLLSNHTILHARTGYEDWDEPARKRHLLRLWLTLHRNAPDGTGRGGIDSIGMVTRA